MKTLKFEIGMGEAFDRLSILQIKKNRLRGERQATAQRQFEELHCKMPSVYPAEYELLSKVNGELWNVEEHLRALERSESFGKTFVEAARSVYKLNDERSRLKTRIDKRFGSDSEVKSYV